jgi:hypothetical protein
MKPQLIFLLLCIGVAQRASGQTVQPASMLSATANQAGRALPGIRVSWYSSLDTKMVFMRVENTSGKNINAYNISVVLKYADGSTDYADGRPSSPSERMEMFGLEGLNGMEPPSFKEGTRRDEPIYQGDKEVSGVEAAADVIVYTDDTAEVQNERAFKQMMATRKGALLALQQVSETIKRVLADGAANPSDAATEELTRVAIGLRKKHSPPEEAENNEEQALQNESRMLDNAAQAAKRMKMSERDYLAKLAEDTDKRVALMTRHCEVAVVGK